MRGERAELNDIFVGFQRGFGQLALVALIQFAILLPETGQEAACHLAERLRQGLQEQRWTGNVSDLAVAQGSDQTTGPDRELAVTVSIGVATLMPAIPTLDVLYARADQALYAAKAGGRNRVSGVCSSGLALEKSQ